MPRLVALRALKLGDLLVAVPAIKALRRAYPEHELVYAAPGWLDPIVGLVPEIDRLLPTPGLDDPIREAGDVDVAVNLHGNGPDSRARIEELEASTVIAHRVGGSGAGAPWEDGVLERERWVRLLEHHSITGDANEVSIVAPEPLPGLRDAAVVHVGAFYGSRMWPVARFARVAKGLARDGHRVVLTGGASEAPRARAVADAAGLAEGDVLAGRSSLVDFASAIAHAAVVVTADTGAGHLASAYGTPSVVIFGPAPPSEWGPPPGPHRVLTNAAMRRGEAFSPVPDPALLSVTADAALRAARDLAGS